MWLHELLAAAKQHWAPLERAFAESPSYNISPRWGEEAHNVCPAD